MVQSDEVSVDKLWWFSKEEHKGSNLTHGIPKAWLSEKYEKILFAIRNSFTCEGIFDTVSISLQIVVTFHWKNIFRHPFWFVQKSRKDGT